MQQFRVRVAVSIIEMTISFPDRLGVLSSAVAHVKMVVLMKLVPNRAMSKPNFIYLLQNATISGPDSAITSDFSQID
jgi:hypothetical protein